LRGTCDRKDNECDLSIPAPSFMGLEGRAIDNGLHMALPFVGIKCLSRGENLARTRPGSPNEAPFGMTSDTDCARNDRCATAGFDGNPGFCGGGVGGPTVPKMGTGGFPLIVPERDRLLRTLAGSGTRVTRPTDRIRERVTPRRIACSGCGALSGTGTSKSLARRDRGATGEVIGG